MGIYCYAPCSEIAGMEYSFNTLGGAIVLKLNEYTFQVVEGEEKTDLPYSFIKEVRLLKFRDHYCTKLFPEIGAPIIINNYTITADGEKQDQSRLYNTFVRVLHMHLESKSNANYIAQSKSRNLLLSLVVSIVIILSLIFASNHIGYLTLYLPLAMFAFIVFIVASYIIYSNLGLTEKYQPNNIPLELLPQNLPV